MELATLGTLPIAGSNPAGSDIRDTEIYEQLVSEINKRAALNSSGPINWQLVVKLSQDILQNHSKDILVCSYLCVGLLNLEGLKGLAQGLHIYCDLLETYWANLYPPRINGRNNAIDWWIESVNEQLRDHEREVWLPDDLAILVKNFERLLDLLENYQISKFSEIRAMLAACKALITTAKPDAPVVPEVSPSTPASASQPVAAPPSTASQSRPAVPNITLPELTGTADVEPALREICSALSKIADIIAQQQPYSYRVLRINRFIAWLDIDTLPPADSESKTMLPPPDERLFQQLEKLDQENNWLELLTFAEGRVIEFRFWLDLSYYVHKALSNLKQLSAAQELAYEVLIYIKRLKGIEQLTFANGVPFASNNTLEWLNSLGQEQGSSATSTTTSEDEEIAQEIEQAKELINQGQLNSAINQLHVKIQTSLTCRERFIRIINFCKFVDSIKQTPLAIPYLQELLTSSKNYQLDNWEPALVSRAYQLILTIARQKKFKLEDNILHEVFNQLVIVDPVSALKFQL